MITIIDDAELLRRAIKQYRARWFGGYGDWPHPRWVAVMEMFSCGSGVAHGLCERFGFDPDEMVSRTDSGTFE